MQNLFRNAPGAPPPVSPELLGPFGAWGMTDSSYFLRGLDKDSRRALQMRGYKPPPISTVEEELERYRERAGEEERVGYNPWYEEESVSKRPRITSPVLRKPY